MVQRLQKVRSAPLFLIGSTLFIFFGWLWWQYVYTSPRQVFWGMVANNLATPGVTRQVEEETAQGKIDQKVQMAFGVQNYTRAITKITQPGVNGENKVTTESVGTNTEDYVRYLSVETPVALGQATPDYSSVQNVWGKSQPGNEQTATPRFFVESLFGIVPFANLPTEKRHELVRYMQENKVYDPSWVIKKQKEGGRQVYVYQVKVLPAAYIAMLQQFAKTLGLGEVPGLDPAAYEEAEATTIEFMIEPRTRQLVRIGYPENVARKETYTAYGVAPRLEFPTQTIGISELQQRVEALQQ